MIKSCGDHYMESWKQYNQCNKIELVHLVSSTKFMGVVFVMCVIGLHEYFKFSIMLF